MVSKGGKKERRLGYNLSTKDPEVIKTGTGIKTGSNKDLLYSVEFSTGTNNL